MIIILTFIMVILVSLILHELGHYFASRLQGVPVPIFSIGYGRALYSFKRWGTEWRISLLPLGGYNLIEGMGKAGSFYESRPLWGKLTILLSGLAVNFILAFISFTLIFYINGKPTSIPNTYVVAAIAPGSPVDGILKPDDLVLSLNKGFPPTIRTQSDLDVYRVQRGTEVLTLNVPSSPDVNTGITYTEKAAKEPITFWQSVLYTPVFLWDFGQVIFSYTYDLITFQFDNSSIESASLFEVISSYDSLFVPIIVLFAVINLAMFMGNSIPFPLLDGGRAIFTVVDHFLGRSLSLNLQVGTILVEFLIFIIINRRKPPASAGGGSRHP